MCRTWDTPDFEDLKRRAKALALRVEIYANLPKDNPTTEAFLKELLEDIEKFGEELEAVVPNVPDRYPFLDRIIRGAIDGGIVETVVGAVVRAVVNIFS
jgi:hypothetical protein